MLVLWASLCAAQHQSPYSPPPPPSPAHPPICNDRDTGRKVTEPFGTHQHFCDAQVAVTPCSCNTSHHLGVNETRDQIRMCLTINRPFVAAIIRGTCYNQEHVDAMANPSASDIVSCVQPNEAALRYLDIMGGLSGFVITATKQDPHGWGYQHSVALNARAQLDPLVDDHPCIYIEEGFVFQITPDSNKGDNQLFRTVNSTYRLGQHFSPSPPPPSPPPSPPPPTPVGCTSLPMRMQSALGRSCARTAPMHGCGFARQSPLALT